MIYNFFVAHFRGFLQRVVKNNTRASKNKRQDNGYKTTFFTTYLLHNDLDGSTLSTERNQKLERGKNAEREENTFH